MKSYFKIAAKGILLIVSLILALYFAVFFDFFGKPQDQGQIEEFNAPFLSPIDKKLSEKTILFGDLHVHTTYSLDAFIGNLPILEGEGTHPAADACNYARFCANLDFFSINDHAEFLTRREWTDTIQSLRDCSRISNESDESSIIPFLGWEWTQTSLDIE